MLVTNVMLQQDKSHIQLIGSIPVAPVSPANQRVTQSLTLLSYRWNLYIFVCLTNVLHFNSAHIYWPLGLLCLIISGRALRTQAKSIGDMRKFIRSIHIDVRANGVSAFIRALLQ